MRLLANSAPFNCALCQDGIVGSCSALRELHLCPAIPVKFTAFVDLYVSPKSSWISHDTTTAQLLDNRDEGLQMACELPGVRLLFRRFLLSYPLTRGTRTTFHRVSFSTDTPSGVNAGALRTVQGMPKVPLEADSWS